MNTVLQRKTIAVRDEQGHILVVGGYGGVGQSISHLLSMKYPGRVIVAGRDYEKAQDFSISLERKVLPYQLDINKGDIAETLFEKVTLVVMCVDQHKTDFVESCIHRGIDYVDITAGHEFLQNVEAFHKEAQLSGSTAILSVGLAPGLTNLLASYAKSHVQDPSHINIFIMLGLGEKHGEAAIRWTLENINHDIWVANGDEVHKSRSFLDGTRTILPGESITRNAYRFNFPDQYIITRTLGLKSASTWLCFDSMWVTNLVANLARWGVLRLLKSSWIQNVTVKVMETFNQGSDAFVLQVKAYNRQDNEQPDFETSIRGFGEGTSTGIVAAKVVDLLYQSNFPPGVFHIEQLIKPAPFLQTLGEEGFEWSKP